MRGVNVPKSTLESIWVPPRFKQQDESGDDIVLDTLLADGSSCLLVLADPGCGKSTLARFLTCFFIDRYCLNQQEFFGLLVPLSGLRTTGLTYEEAVVHCAARAVGLEVDSEAINDLRSNFSRAFVIFDGLDELPERDELLSTTRYPFAEMQRS
jgi:hypothetical protein